jgi:hypothetical protein
VRATRGSTKIEPGAFALYAGSGLHTTQELTLEVL